MNARAPVGTVNQNAPRGWLRLLLRVPILVYRLKLGWMLGRRLVLLTHTGRRSGKTHSTVLEALSYDTASCCCFIASDWGTRSQWYMNVMRNPLIEYTVGSRERAGRAEQLPVDRAEQALRRYANRHRTAMRIRTRFLIGEDFDASSDQFRRLAARVPVLKLVPMEGHDAIDR